MDIVVFGLGTVAEVVRYYFLNESDFNIVAFTCDREFKDRDKFLDFPVVAFEDVEHAYPAGEVGIFVALGYQDMNALRAKRVADAKAKGYRTPSYVHPSAGVPKDTRLGNNCFIMNNVCIQPQVRLGDNVFIWSGALIGHHSVIGDNCWITSSANIAGSVNVGRNCFFGVNATVGNEVTIGDNCFLGASTLVTKDLADSQVVIEKSSEVHRLTTEQFLRISRFK